MHAAAQDIPNGVDQAAPVAGLAVQRLTKRFGSRVVVDAVDLTIAAGQILCLVGPSGSGKSTVINCVAGFAAPDDGTIDVGGKNVTDEPLGKRGVAVVFQDYRLFPRMTVRENVAFPLRAASRAARDAMNTKRVESVLEAVHMSDRADSYPHQLSGGEKQRTALARALVTRPALLCMDEPLGALDMMLRTELQQEIRRLQHETGVTVLYVTHDQQEALVMADVLAVIRDGKILQVGSPRTVYDRPASVFVASFIGECNVFAIRDATRIGDHLVNFVTHNGTDFRAATETDPERDARIGVRPEAFRPRAVVGLPTLDGTVVDRTFVGAHERAVVRLHTGDVLRLLFTDGEDVPGIGQPITLSYEPSSVHVLSRTI